MELKNIKLDQGINHPKYGYVRYMGLKTINPFSKKISVPHKYVLRQSPDEKGMDRPDILETDGSVKVELID